MTEEFNLSNKIIMKYDRRHYAFGKLYAKDVKEFIKRLKEEMDLSWANCEIINKLAGDILI